MPHCANRCDGLEGIHIGRLHEVKDGRDSNLFDMFLSLILFITYIKPICGSKLYGGKCGQTQGIPEYRMNL